MRVTAIYSPSCELACKLSIDVDRYDRHSAYITLH